MTAHNTMLSVEQAAETLNCSTDTVRRMIANGKLRAFRVGRLIRLRPEDLQKSLKPVTSTGA